MLTIKPMKPMKAEIEDDALKTVSDALKTVSAIIAEAPGEDFDLVLREIIGEVSVSYKISAEELKTAWDNRPVVLGTRVLPRVRIDNIVWMDEPEVDPGDYTWDLNPRDECSGYGMNAED